MTLSDHDDLWSRQPMMIERVVHHRAATLSSEEFGWDWLRGILRLGALPTSTEPPGRELQERSSGSLVEISFGR